jgi:trk system potassium uptake protein TrkA
MVWKEDDTTMRVAFIGASEVAVRTAEALTKRGHEVVIIEVKDEKVKELSEVLDCSFIRGDGSSPTILREVSPEQTDVLFCLTNSDQANLIAALVGRSLGFKRVIPSIENPELEEICRELGLKDTIIPSVTISRYLADITQGRDILELSTVIKNDARFLSFTVKKAGPHAVKDMELPQGSSVVCYYRDDQFWLPQDETKFKDGDEVVVITHSNNLSELRERWQQK